MKPQIMWAVVDCHGNCEGVCSTKAGALEALLTLEIELGRIVKVRVEELPEGREGVDK